MFLPIWCVEIYEFLTECLNISASEQYAWRSDLDDQWG